jgi:hypothetical protein
LVQSLGGYPSTSPLAPQFLENGTLPSVTFSQVIAINSLLSKLDSIKTIVEKCKSSGTSIDKENFAQTANRLFQFSPAFSPLEIDVLFKMVKGGQGDSFNALFDPSQSVKVDRSGVQISALMETAKVVYNFALGSIAGATGAFAVYPIGKR